MADTVLQLLNKMVADRVASTRKELVVMSKNLLLRRLRTFGRRAIEDALALTNASCQNNALKYSGGEESHVWGLSKGGTVSTRTGELHEDSVSADLQLVVLLLLLHGDESPDVAVAAAEVNHNVQSYFIVSNIPYFAYVNYVSYATQSCEQCKACV